jgi:hypothetical protein
MDISQRHRPLPKEYFLKVDSCCNRFDYSLSNRCLEHLYRGSGQARSAFVLTHFHNINNNQKYQFPSRSLTRHHSACTLSNNRRTLSPKTQEICLRNRFDPPFTLRNQEDCSPTGQQIHLHKEQFFAELTLKPTIKIKSGKSPQRASLRYGGLFTA